jgi:hypothetical protein
MSLSEFEAAVCDESVARHAYIDALQAALPACEDSKTRAIDKSDYDEAAMFSAIAKAIVAILAGIEKPVSKADIRASLDGGIFEAPHREWQREKSNVERDIGQSLIDLERRVQSATDVAARRTAQLLDEEKTAARKDDFALAKQLKEAREKSIRDGEQAVNEVKMEGERALNELKVGCDAFRLPLIKSPPSQVMMCVLNNRTILQVRLSGIISREPKPSDKSYQLEQRAIAIVNHMPQTQGQGLKSLSALLIPPQAAGYDVLPSLKAAGYTAAAFRAAGCDWATVMTAGFSALEAKAAGCDVAAAHAAGYDVLSLLSLFGYDAVAAAGCDVSSHVLVSCTPALPRAFAHTNAR